MVHRRHRDHLGNREDRFFATVFLGSGLLFLALLFVGGAIMSTLVAMGGDRVIDSEVWRFGRRLFFTIVDNYALRTAAVFAIATTTLAGRLGALPRWLQVVGYVTAFALLVAATSAPWVKLLFPLWVLLVSSQILLAGKRALTKPDAGT